MSFWEIPGEHTWNRLLPILPAVKSPVWQDRCVSLKPPEGMCVIYALLLAAQNEFIVSIAVCTNICCQISSPQSTFMDYSPCFEIWDILKSLIHLWYEQINHARWYWLSKLAQLGFLCNLMLIKSIFGFIDKTSFTFKLPCGPLLLWWNNSVSNAWSLESIRSYVSRGFSRILLTYNIYLKYPRSKYVNN